VFELPANHLVARLSYSSLGKVGQFEKTLGRVEPSILEPKPLLINTVAVIKVAMKNEVVCFMALLLVLWL